MTENAESTSTVVVAAAANLGIAAAKAVAGGLLGGQPTGSGGWDGTAPDRAVRAARGRAAPSAPRPGPAGPQAARPAAARVYAVSGS
ncbi:hypothetical protein ACFW2Y_25170 [Streptomyces sp. NPDC058877]|uniref:hypothetical protein n=1 Tax=Streptomyces sp. NPDC058877 TaxID=3346665 RepID=UPI0036CCF3C8